MATRSQYENSTCEEWQRRRPQNRNNVLRRNFERQPSLRATTKEFDEKFRRKVLSGVFSSCKEEQEKDLQKCTNELVETMRMGKEDAHSRGHQAWERFWERFGQRQKKQRLVGAIGRVCWCDTDAQADLDRDAFQLHVLQLGFSYPLTYCISIILNIVVRHDIADSAIFSVGGETGQGP